MIMSFKGDVGLIFRLFIHAHNATTSVIVHQEKDSHGIMESQ